LQIGNAVPVAFAKRIAFRVKIALEVLDGKRKFTIEEGEQISLF